VYRRSLAVFFLATPPTDFDTMRDFRRLDGAEAGRWSADLHSEYRRAHVQRDYLLELDELDEIEPATDWRIRQIPDDDEVLAAQARRVLLAVTPLPLPTGASTPYEHLNTWVAALERAGVLVMATKGGRVTIGEMRGFSLYFEQLPVIVVNGADHDLPVGRRNHQAYCGESYSTLIRTSVIRSVVLDIGVLLPGSRRKHIGRRPAGYAKTSRYSRPSAAATPAMISTNWPVDPEASRSAAVGALRTSWPCRLTIASRGATYSVV